MKVLDCMTLVLKELAKERRPYNLLAGYDGKYPKQAAKGMEMLQNFEPQAEAVAMRMAAGKPDIFHALGETAREKGTLKVLEEEGTLQTSVDLLYAGSADIEIKGIGCTFMATMPVLEQAKQKGINFIITHEPTYYSGNDDTSWLQNDPVYQQKKAFLEENRIAVWRLHDMMHLFQPDMIVEGVLRKLGLYEKAEFQTAANVILHTGLSRRELYDLMREKLNCKSIRMVGKMDGKAEKIGFFVGSLGGKPQISIASQYAPDAVVCGEISEWETAPYIRDAVACGRDIALFVIGHQESETAGMEYLADWLKRRVSGIPVSYLESGPMLNAVEI